MRVKTDFSSLIEIVPDKYYLSADKYQWILVEKIYQKSKSGLPSNAIADYSYHGSLEASLKYALKQTSKQLPNLQSIITLLHNAPKQWAKELIEKHPELSDKKNINRNIK